MLQLDLDSVLHKKVLKVWALLLPSVMEIEAFSLCVILTKAPSGAPWDKRAPALSSSQDQCA